MTLARIFKIVRFAATCEDHPSWAVPSSSSYEYVEKLTKEHNDAEHRGVETR